MRNDDRKLAVMRTLPIFARCSPKELKQIAALGDLVTVPPARVLMAGGTRSDEAYVVVSGEAVVTDGDREIARVGAGEALGEMSVLESGARRSATVTSATDMELLVFVPRAFSAMLEHHPEVGQQVASTLAARLRNLQDASIG